MKKHPLLKKRTAFTYVKAKHNGNSPFPTDPTNTNATITIFGYSK